MTKIYQENIQIQEEHIDDLQHVNNVVFLQFVQDIASKHWYLNTEHLLLSHFVWVAREHQIEYFANVGLNEKLLVKTFVEKMEGVTSFRVVEFYHENKLVCKCNSRWILVDQDSLRPRRIPSEISSLFL